MKFRKRPVTIEAMQWDGTPEGATPIIDWVLTSGGTARYICSDVVERCVEFDGDCPHIIAIDTLEGTMTASLGDWIIRGVRGEFYPCKPAIFAETYSPVGGAPDDRRLYGCPGDERLDFDPADVYESRFDPYVEDGEPLPHDGVIEEWTIHPPRDHLPSPDRLLEAMQEWAFDNEVDTDGDDWFDGKDPELLAAAEALLDAIAEKVTWRQAAKKVAEHKVTVVDGEPHLDGEPLYRSVESLVEDAHASALDVALYGQAYMRQSSTGPRRVDPTDTLIGDYAEQGKDPADG